MIKNPSFWRDDLDTQMPSGRGSTSTALGSSKGHFHSIFLPKNIFLTSFALHVGCLPWPWACSLWPKALTSRSHMSLLLLSVTLLYRRRRRKDGFSPDAGWASAGCCCCCCCCCCCWADGGGSLKLGLLKWVSCVLVSPIHVSVWSVPYPVTLGDISICVRLSNPLMFQLLSLEVKCHYTWFSCLR